MAFLTLSGGGVADPRVEALSGVCLLCGTRGTADAVLNVVLFLPLGAAIATWGRTALRVMIVGLAVSACIESVQLFLPGRHAAVSDLLWNTLGAGVGAWSHTLISRRLRGDWTLDLAWGLALASGFLVAGLLMTPAPTPEDYWGQWTPDLGFMPQYGGEVLEASLDGAPLPPGRIDHPGPDAPLVRGGWTVEATFLVGPPSASVSPIVSIYDGGKQEILLFGNHGQDLVFRERTWARTFRFDLPDVRIVGAFEELGPGDSTVLRGERNGDGLCLALGDSGACGLGATPGRSWGLLLYVEGLPERLRKVVDAVWLLILFFPVGFFGGSLARMSAACAVALAGMAAAPMLTPLIVGPWHEFLAAPLGVLTGWSAVWTIRRVADLDQLRSAESISASV